MKTIEHAHDLENVIRIYSIWHDERSLAKSMTLLLLCCCMLFGVSLLKRIMRGDGPLM